MAAYKLLTHEEQWSKQKADNDEEMGILSFPTTCHRWQADLRTDAKDVKC